VSDADPAAFRQAAGQFAGGIVVVTTSSGHAMTVSEFVSVSLEPPLVLFCAEKIARFHDAVVAAGMWAVSILAADGEKTARWLATRSRPGPGQLDGVAHRPGPVTGAPLLDGALATLECVTDAVHDGGDHSIIVGRVAAVARPPAADQSSPLVHYAGTYRHLRPLAHGFLDAVQAPEEICLADDQRRGQPDHVAVGLLGQHAEGGEPLAHRTSG
jgi:flavin reductase (DIM6/NTAB) family NADH-FMN oxidoreductase RutF